MSDKCNGAVTFLKFYTFYKYYTINNEMYRDANEDEEYAFR